jgi:hypothetical protein
MTAGADLSGSCDGTTLEIWGVLSGEIKLNTYEINAVEFSLLPASMGPYRIKAKTNSVLLRTFAA